MPVIKSKTEHRVVNLFHIYCFTYAV